MANSFFNLIGTLFVGATVLLLLCTFFWIFAPIPRKEVPPNENLLAWLERVGAFPTAPVPLAMLIFLAFGVGIVVEGVTDHMTDSETELWLTEKTLQSEKDHRFGTMFRERDGNIVPRGLARELFQLPQVRQMLADQSFTEDIATYFSPDLEHVELQRRIDVGKGYINKVYFAAKNWAYTIPTYFEELERLQRRIDLARSLFLVLLCSAILVAVIMIVLLTAVGINQLLRGALMRIVSIPSDTNTNALRVSISRSFEEPSKYLHKSFARICLVGLVTIPCALACIIAFVRAEEQFNERVFGYFSSECLRRNGALERLVPMEIEKKMRYDAAVWMQTAAEYRAICLDTFSRALEATIRFQRTNIVSKPVAVVLDLDETVLDNTAFNVQLLRNDSKFAPNLWRRWTEQSSDAILQVPGAVEFITEARSNSIEVVYISNREEVQRPETLEVLGRFGLGSNNQIGSHLYLQNGDSNKAARRKEVNSRFAVAVWIGDNLADFDGRFDSSTVSEVSARWRAAGQSEVLEHLGRDWFLLPNPLYGDWERIVDWRYAEEYSSKLNPRVRSSP